MGISIRLNINPARIDHYEWESMYQESLKLLEAYDFMDKIVDKETFKGFAWIYGDKAKEKKLSLPKDAIGWYVFGDVVTMETGENFVLRKDLNTYIQETPKNENCFEEIYLYLYIRIKKKYISANLNEKRKNNESNNNRWLTSVSCCTGGKFNKLFRGIRMKTTIQLHDFIHCDALKDFSYDGRVALFEYLEQYEEDCGIEIDFDPVAIRCDFTEYANLDEVGNYYTDLQDEPEEEKLEWLQDRTQVIEFETGIILQDF
jgi:hypothetical protein